MSKQKGGAAAADRGATAIVVVGGGKQYRVAAGDRILVDRLDAAAGDHLKLDQVLMLVDGDEFTVGTPLVKGEVVTARVINHPRGPKIDMIRYKSKKHVRVHRGARADLTVLEILTVGASRTRSAEAGTSAKSEAKPSAKSEAKASSDGAAEAAPETTDGT